MLVTRIPEHVQNVMARLEAAGWEVWCVGGGVRDMLLGRDPGDWDVTTSARPEDVMALFGPAAQPTGLKHGTVTVGGNRGVGVTTFRRDGDYLDNRHPDHVEFTTSLEEDLSRRDFTVNAMLMDICTGEIVDHWGGREDLRDGVLRHVEVAFGAREVASDSEHWPHPFRWFNRDAYSSIWSGELRPRRGPSGTSLWPRRTP